MYFTTLPLGHALSSNQSSQKSKKGNQGFYEKVFSRKLVRISN